MTWKECCELREPLLQQIRKLKQQVKDFESEYIEEHKEFKKGDHIIVIANGIRRHTVVVGHDVNDQGRVIPRLMIMKKSRTSKPTFYHQHEFDESIVLELTED